jgi:hypothetical protein
MLLSFEEHDKDAGSLLQCPACRGNCLRHSRVEVFEREEDSKSGLHVSVADSCISVDASLKGNPSERRHGLLIHFDCENCDSKAVLSVAQHKGNTWVNIKQM